MPDIVNISRDDLPELARRFQAAFPSALMTEQNLQRKIWGDPDYAPDLNLIVRRGPRIDAALLGVMRDKVAFVKIITPADPAAMQTLYDEFESRVRARKAERIDASGSAPNRKRSQLYLSGHRPALHRPCCVLSEQWIREVRGSVQHDGAAGEI